MAVEQLQRVVIKEELVNLTGGHREAAFLNNLIFWGGIIEKQDKSILSKIEREKDQKKIDRLIKKLRNGWFYQTSEEMLDHLMGWGSPATVTRMMKDFEKKKWIDKGRNPVMKWDRKTYYKVNFDRIARDLKELGYALDGFTLYEDEESPKLSSFQNEKSVVEPLEDESDLKVKNEETPELPIFHGEISNFQNERSSFQNERAITEGLQQKVYLSEVCKTNQPIIDEIEEYDFPKNIEKTLKEMVGRLATDKIEISDIHRHYESYKDVYSSSEYDLTLYDVLSKVSGKINKFSSIMNDWLEKARKLKNKMSEKVEPVKREVEKENEVIEHKKTEKKTDWGSKFHIMEEKNKKKGLASSN